MAVISLETHIKAPIEKVFDLARNIQIHAQSAAWTGEKVVEGKVTLLEKGDTVTFEAKHLGKRRRHQSRVTQFDPPNGFTDKQLKGGFKFFSHQHSFHTEADGGTLMYDIVEYKAPAGPIGMIMDKLFLEKYLREYLIRRNQNFKKIAEEQAAGGEKTLDPSRTPTIPPQ